MSTPQAQEMLGESPLSVVLVYVDENLYLALTGGGMDLSWDICEAYMLLGYLPPLEFCSDLPLYADMPLDVSARWVLSGCMESHRAVKIHADENIRQLRALRQRMKNRTSSR